MKTSVLFLLLVIPSLFFSQDDESPFVQNGYMGYSLYRPNFKNDFKRLGDWEGVEFTFKDMVLSYYRGSLRDVNADSTFASPSGKLFSAGYRFGKEFNLGKNSFFSAGVKPFIQFSVPLSSVTNKVTNSPTYSLGAVLSPGLQVRFSHLYVIAKYDAGLHFNQSFWAKNGRHNAVKGYLGGLSLTVGLENAFDLLSPELFSFKGLRYTKKKYKRIEDGKYDRKTNTYYYNEVTTTVTEYSPGEVATNFVRPFWGIGPSYSFNALADRQAPTRMTGLNFGVRVNYWMIDGFYEEGNIGLSDKVGREEIITTYPQLRNYDFSSQVKGKRYGGRIGFNLSRLLMFSNFKENSDGNMAQVKASVPFLRFSAFYTMGVTEFLEKPNYTFEDGSARLADYQTKSSITPSAENNPDYLPTKANFSGYGVSFEIGAAYMNYTWYKYKNATIADHNSFTIGANIPLGRIFHSARARYVLGKMARK